MNLFDEETNLFPRVASSAEIVQVINNEIVLAFAIGQGVSEFLEKSEVPELGDSWVWHEEGKLSDQPHGDYVLATAIKNVRSWAQDMEIMYRKESMEACVVQALSFAFECGKERDINRLEAAYKHTI